MHIGRRNRYTRDPKSRTILQNRWYAWHMRLDRNPRRHATAERRPSHKETQTTKRSYAYGLTYYRGSNKESPPDDSSSYPCTLLPPPPSLCIQLFVMNMVAVASTSKCQTSPRVVVAFIPHVRPVLLIRENARITFLLK